LQRPATVADDERPRHPQQLAHLRGPAPGRPPTSLAHDSLPRC
jgi:hypothetical protein